MSINWKLFLTLSFGQILQNIEKTYYEFIRKKIY